MGELELDSIDRLFLTPSDPSYDRDYRRALCHRVLLRNDETVWLPEEAEHPNKSAALSIANLLP